MDGRVTEKKGDVGYQYGFFPYGKIPAWSTEAFKNIPSAVIALSLAEMYAFLKKPPSEWDQLAKKRSYPMTSLWLWGVIKRHLCFQEQFRSKKEFLFFEYEEGGGEYHGGEEVVHTVRKEVEDNGSATLSEGEDSDLEFV